MRPPSSARALADGPVRRSELRAVAGFVGGEPALVSRYHTSPLKIAKTFRLEAGAAKQLAVVQMDGSPGMLEGDSYLFDWRLQEGVRLYATNQAYTRVHPCGDGYSRLEQRFALARGSVLEWMPEPVMLFKDARLFADTEIDLEDGAICMIGDVFSPGRLSRGESFAFAAYDNRLTVRHGGELVHYQRQRWEPERLPLKTAGCFGNATHLGSFSVFSDKVDAGTAAKLRDWLEAMPERDEDVQWGVSHTARCGVVVQAAGGAAWRLERLVRAAWAGARELLLGEPPLRLLRGQ